MSHAMILYSAIAGIVLTLSGVGLNSYLGGRLWEYPTRFKKPAKYIYFGGWVIFLIGPALALLL